MDDSASYFGGGLLVGAFIATMFFALFALPNAEKRAYARGLCHSHGGVQVEIADTLACIRPPTTVRIDDDGD